MSRLPSKDRNSQASKVGFRAHANGALETLDGAELQLAEGVCGELSIFRKGNSNSPHTARRSHRAGIFGGPLVRRRTYFDLPR